MTRFCLLVSIFQCAVTFSAVLLRLCVFNDGDSSVHIDLLLGKQRYRVFLVDAAWLLLIVGFNFKDSFFLS